MPDVTNTPILKGKTYTLFGDSESTSEYYETIRYLATMVSAMEPDTANLIGKLAGVFGRKKVTETGTGAQKRWQI